MRVSSNVLPGRQSASEDAREPASARSHGPKHERLRRITNAVAEGLNSKIQTIKKAAYGFRSFENFKTAIFFHCGGLRLYPVTHANPG